MKLDFITERLENIGWTDRRKTLDRRTEMVMAETEGTKIQRIRQVFEQEYFLEEMELIYDYRTSLEHEYRFDHLPTPEEIAHRLPNPCGWRSGMEDSVMNCGVALGSSPLETQEITPQFRPGLKMMAGLRRKGVITAMLHICMTPRRWKQPAEYLP